MSIPILLSAEKISKSYHTQTILENLDFTLPIGKMVSILGPSGSGKSSLLNIFGLLDKQDIGKVIIDNKDTSFLKEKEKSILRNKIISFIFQFHYLLPEFSALENVCLPAWVKPTMSSKQIEDKAKDILESLGLSSVLHKKPNTLSGGEQQRVAVARSLINSPKIVLADEPTGNLDNENTKTLLHLFKKVQKEKNIAFIIVTHNDWVAKQTDITYTLFNKKLKKV